MENKFFFKIIAAITIITITSCAAGSFKTKEQKSAKYIVQKCFDEQIASCGDLLCEMSTDNVYEILIQVKENILTCVEEGEK